MIEKLFELLAPDECVVCGREGECLCAGCADKYLRAKKHACVLCNSINDDGKVCSKCTPKTRLSGASVGYRYMGVIKELVRMMKYENRRSIARYFAKQLPTPELKGDLVISFVPSDGRSRRARGFDQAELLARSYAKQRKICFRRLLIRSEHTKQVGQKRQERFASVAGNFQLRGSIEQYTTVILVDDVITTGATLSECAKVLKMNGIKKIWAVAIAKK